MGSQDDPVFGPTVMFGLRGIFTEVLRDVTFRIAPLDRIDAEEMIREIGGFPLLAGFRGQPSRDIDALIDLILAVSCLVIEDPNRKELDLNPARVFEQGVMVLDVRIKNKECLTE